MISAISKQYCTVNKDKGTFYYCKSQYGLTYIYYSRLNGFCTELACVSLQLMNIGSTYEQVLNNN